MYPAEGFAGGPASANTMYAGAVLAGEDIPVGRFVSVGGSSGINGAAAPARAFAGGNAVGIASRIRPGAITDITQEASNIINRNMPLEITVSGDLYAVVDNPDSVLAGQMLFYRVSESSEGSGDAGSVRAAAKGAAIADFVESAWHVVSVADAGSGLVKASTVRTV